MFDCSAVVDWEELPEQTSSGDNLFTRMPESTKIDPPYYPQG